MDRAPLLRSSISQALTLVNEVVLIPAIRTGTRDTCMIYLLSNTSEDTPWSKCRSNSCMSVGGTISIVGLRCSMAALGWSQLALMTT